MGKLNQENNTCSLLQASKVQPDDLGAHQNVARAYERLGNLSAAEATYRKAKSLLPQVNGKKI